MAKGLIEESILTDIADAIRETDGTTAKMLASVMAGKIRATSAKVATGTFSKSSSGWPGTITVSNVGFKPKQIAFFLNNSRSQDYDSGRTYFLGGMYGNTKTAYLCVTAYSDGAISLKAALPSTAKMSVTLNNRGFVLSASRSQSSDDTHWLLGNYAYIAIG